MNSPRLSVSGLRLASRTTVPLHGIDLDISAGEVLCLVGPNGSGKTLLLSLVAGLAPAEGRVCFDGVDVTKEPVHRRVRRGILLAPSGGRVFPGMTVEENLRLGWEAGTRETTFEEALRDTGRRFPWTGQRLGQRAETLSGGERHIIASALTILASPKVLLLDEPCCGLSQGAVRSLTGWLEDLARAGSTVIVAEQAPAIAAAEAFRTVLMAAGRFAGETRGLTIDEGSASSVVRRLFYGEPGGGSH